MTRRTLILNMLRVRPMTTPEIREAVRPAGKSVNHHEANVWKLLRDMQTKGQITGRNHDVPIERNGFTWHHTVIQWTLVNE